MIYRYTVENLKMTIALLFYVTLFAYFFPLQYSLMNIYQNLIFILTVEIEIKITNKHSRN